MPQRPAACNGPFVLFPDRACAPSLLLSDDHAIEGSTSPKWRRSRARLHLQSFFGRQNLSMALAMSDECKNTLKRAEPMAQVSLEHPG